MSRETAIHPDLLAVLRCPSSGLPLRVEGEELVSADGSNRYPIVGGIPCLMPHSADPTHAGYRTLIEENREQLDGCISEEAVAKFIEAMIVPTCGNLFRRAEFANGYPIPEFPGGYDANDILEIGCNWGRWTIAGAQAGHRMIGVDIHLKSLLCARWLARQLVPGNEPLFVLADARYLPFASESLGGVFSYSCIQHFSRTNAERILSEVSRVMRPAGKSIIQMPNKRGLRSTVTLTRRGFSDGSEFDVRYYSITELLQMFERSIGKSDWEVDCFLGLNVHGRDRNFVVPAKRWIVDLAEALRWTSRRFPLVRRFSDSIFVSSTKVPTPSADRAS